MLSFNKNYAKSERDPEGQTSFACGARRERESKNFPQILKITLTSLIAAFACTGIIYAATTIGTNISTTGTLTSSGINTLYGATTIGGALTATSTLTVEGNTILTTASSTGIVKFAQINSDTGAISFGNENLSTTGTLNITGLTTLGNASTTVLSVSGSTYLATTTISGNLSVAGTYSDDYNGRNELGKWDGKISDILNENTGNAVVLVIADSYLATQVGLIGGMQRYWWDKFGHAGGGYVSANVGNGSSDATSVPLNVTRSQTGTWSNTAIGSSAEGSINASTALTSTAGDELTITCNATDFIIHYVKKNDGAKFTWQVDSGGTTQVDSDSLGAATTLEKVSITGQADASHVLHIVQDENGKSLQLAGVECNRNVTGVRVHNTARASNSVNAIASADATEWQSEVTQLNPDLVFIAMGVNDANGSRTASQVKTDLQTIITRLKATIPGISIILSTQLDTSTLDYSDYATAIKELAVENNTGFIDFHKRFGNYATGFSRGLYADTVHPTAGGQAIWENMLHEFLSDTPIRRLPSSYTNYSFGYNNLTQNVSGTGNVAIGTDIMNNNTTGWGNIAMGDAALKSNTTGDFNVALGYNALEANTTADQNVAVGFKALEAATTGGYNTAFGALALNALTTGINNIGIGGSAGLLLQDGDSNIYIGLSAGDASVSADSNVGIGVYALTANTTGGNNTAIGTSAMRDNTTGYSHTCVGYQSCQNQTTALANTAIGFRAGEGITTGGLNTVIGASAFLASAGSQQNTVIGYDALSAQSSGNYNVIIGDGAAHLMDGRSNNVVIGSEAGTNLDHDRNVVIGRQAAAGQTSSSGNVIIGNSVCKTGGVCGGVAATVDNILAIDNNDDAAPLLFGSFASGSEYLTINGKLNLPSLPQGTGAANASVTGSVVSGVMCLTNTGALFWDTDGTCSN